MIIENAYDEFHQVVSDALVAHGATLTPVISFREHDDNVIIENNDEKILKNGFSIQFGSDVNEATTLSSLTQISQTAYLTLTTANFGTIKDIDKRKLAEKKLLAAKDAVMVAIGGNPQLNATVAKCIYEGTDPVELVIDDNEKVFLMVKSTYTIGYFERSTF